MADQATNDQRDALAENRWRDLSPPDINTRVDGCDWTDISAHLDAYGWATLPKLLTAREAGAIVDLYDDAKNFRSHVVMARHGFGRGEYKYFAYPLPAVVAGLRTALVPPAGPGREPLERIDGDRRALPRRTRRLSREVS